MIIRVFICDLSSLFWQGQQICRVTLLKERCSFLNQWTFCCHLEPNFASPASPRTASSFFSLVQPHRNRIFCPKNQLYPCLLLAGTNIRSLKGSCVDVYICVIKHFTDPAQNQNAHALKRVLAYVL